jgi:hypothetical protein
MNRVVGIALSVAVGASVAACGSQAKLLSSTSTPATQTQQGTPKTTAEQLEAKIEAIESAKAAFQKAYEKESGEDREKQVEDPGEATFWGERLEKIGRENGEEQIKRQTEITDLRKQLPEEGRPTPSSKAGTETATPATLGAKRVRSGTPSETRVLTAAASANHTCGFDTSSDYLADVRVTSGGWAAAQINAHDPSQQGNCGIIFQKSAEGWHVVTSGSSFAGSSIPESVIAELGQ